jgi:hypothetical protein
MMACLADHSAKKAIVGRVYLYIDTLCFSDFIRLGRLLANSDVS